METIEINPDMNLQEQLKQAQLDLLDIKNIATDMQSAKKILPAELTLNVSSTTLVSDNSSANMVEFASFPQKVSAVASFEMDGEFSSSVSGIRTSFPIEDCDASISNAPLASESLGSSASFQIANNESSESKTIAITSEMTSADQDAKMEEYLYQDMSQESLLDDDANAASAALDDQTQMNSQSATTIPSSQAADVLRHGISRYAPYGTRFAALMRDGTYKMSHIAGDLANRARTRGEKGGRVELALVTHKGEREQLDSALSFYENANTKAYAFGPRPGPSEVLNHLKELGIDWDYRKGENVKLLQRNASNFFKRMMEHARRLSHPLAEAYSLPSAPSNATMIAPSVPAPQPSVAPAVEADPSVRKAAAILASMMFAKIEEEPIDEDQDEMDIDHNTDYSYQSIVSSSSHSKNDRYSYGEDISDSTRITDWGRPKHHAGSFYYEVCRHTAAELSAEKEYYDKAAESFDWTSVEDVTSAYKPNRVVAPSRRPALPSLAKPKRGYYHGNGSDSEFDEWGNGNRSARNGVSSSVSKKQKVIVEKSQTFTPSAPRQRQAPKAFISNGSVPSTAPPAVIRKGREGLSAGVFLKGLSRHSPYGTRFCATMPNGEKRESYLAGDLADRVRSGPGGGELLLVLHAGEIDQLQSAWEFVVSHEDSYNIGAGQVLEYLRQVGKDANHRKPGTALLQKNAGNFFKRVQEYGKRKTADPNYLSMTPRFSNEEAQPERQQPAPATFSAAETDIPSLSTSVTVNSSTHESSSIDVPTTSDSSISLVNGQEDVFNLNANEILQVDEKDLLPVDLPASIAL